jgi:hypothetical protein
VKRTLLSTSQAALCSIGAWAQSVAGSGVVSGVILESSGNGLRDARIVIENDAIGITRSVDSSLDGVFEAVGLASGSAYRLRVTRQKFVEWRGDSLPFVPGERLYFEITVARDGGFPKIRTRGRDLHLPSKTRLEKNNAFRLAHLPLPRLAG